ncbi:MAG: hypothetical protein AAFX80_03515 [Cyanobacteria bacterium J06639_18]
MRNFPLLEILGLTKSIWELILKIPISERDSNSILTYSAVIKYFVTERPEDIKIKKGAVLLEKCSQGFLITQVFLDSNNQLVCDVHDRPYGRRVLAIKIDKELQDAFGKQNLIIVE